MKYKKMLLLSVICLFFVGCGSDSRENDNEVPAGVICSVNGEYIFESEIINAYEQFNRDYSYSKILENSILEMLVVQMAPEYELTVSDDEIQSAILTYKTCYPTFFEAALMANTEEELRAKLETNLLFGKVKEYVYNYIISNKENITQAELLGFKQKYGLVDHLKGYSDETVIYSLWTDIQNYLFWEWVNNLKKNADIIIYTPNSTDNDLFQSNQLSSKIFDKSEYSCFLSV